LITRVSPELIIAPFPKLAIWSLGSYKRAVVPPTQVKMAFLPSFLKVLLVYSVCPLPITTASKAPFTGSSTVNIASVLKTPTWWYQLAKKVLPINSDLSALIFNEVSDGSTISKLIFVSNLLSSK